MIMLALIILYLTFLDEYLGCRQWAQNFVSYHYERLKAKTANDPRVDVILPRSVRRLGNWISHGDTKVQNSVEDVRLQVLLFCIETPVGKFKRFLFNIRYLAGMSTVRDCVVARKQGQT
jgi:hypothetical protein